MITRGLLGENVAVGYDKHEAPLVVGIALRFPTLMLGSHGIGKSVTLKTLARALAQIEGKNSSGFRYFSCDKVNMISLAGMPDTAAMQRGEFNFLPNNRSVFGDDVQIIVLDEVTRAKPEQQNQLMEILEENTCHGIPLRDGVAKVACANPITYQGTQDLDDAFFDRFCIVFQIESMLAEATDVELRHALRINREREQRMSTVIDGFAALIKETRLNYAELINDPDITDRVDNFIGAFWSRLDCRLPEAVNAQGQKEKLYVSPRNITYQLQLLIYGFAAYHKARDEANYLVAGAQDAILYNLQLKFNNDQLNRAINMLFRTTKFVLEASTSSREGKLRLAWANLKTFRAYMSYVSEHIDDMVELFDPAELTQMVGMIIDEARNSNNRSGLVDLRRILGGRSQFEHVVPRLQSEIVFAVLDKWLDAKSAHVGIAPINKPNFTDWNSVQRYLDDDAQVVTGQMNF
jgi:MoxR-like ATPase